MFVGAFQTGFERNRQGKIGDGLVVETFALICIPPIVVGIGQYEIRICPPRFERYRLGVIDDSLVIEALLVISISPIEISNGKTFGKKGNRLIVIGDRLVVD